MKTIALGARYDGNKIELDEPYPLPENARLVVIVLPHDDERQDWLRLSVQQLARAYNDNEPEYTEADLRK
ncbi:MAG TPA: hypothetical protein VMO17_03115 [Terriglobia bacterium]|nr:hypothetical protein [Terriglobia bacterium]